MRKTLRLPIRLSYGATGGAQFSTEVVTTPSGFEQRNINWDMPKARYNLSTALESKEDIESLINFFNIHRGRALSFRFKDFCDYKVKDQTLGFGDGKNCSFYLVKSYSAEELSLERKITKPVEGLLKVYVKDRAVKFSCNYETGEIILDEIPNSGERVSADFEFDVHVRFDIDHIEISPEPLHNYKDISLVEVV